MAAATCTGGVGFASLSAPKSLAGSSRSRSVTAMAQPASQLQDPRPMGSTVHHPLTAADLTTAAEGRLPCSASRRSTVEDWARRGHRPVQEGRPPTALRPGEDRGPAPRPMTPNSALSEDEARRLL